MLSLCIGTISLSFESTRTLFRSLDNNPRFLGIEQPVFAIKIKLHELSVCSAGKPIAVLVAAHQAMFPHERCIGDTLTFACPLHTVAILVGRWIQGIQHGQFLLIQRAFAPESGNLAIRRDVLCVCGTWQHHYITRKSPVQHDRGHGERVFGCNCLDGITLVDWIVPTTVHPLAAKRTISNVGNPMIGTKFANGMV
jgi:hypothetical protein